jgi:hypothetical protein
MPHGHHVSSAVLVPVTPMFTTAERLALAGFLAGYSGLTPRPTSWTCASMRPGARPATWPCSAPGGRTSSFARDLEPRGWGPRHRHTAAVHHRQVLPVRHQRTAPGSLARRACLAAAAGLRGRHHPARPRTARPSTWPSGSGARDRYSSPRTAAAHRAARLHRRRAGHGRPAAGCAGSRSHAGPRTTMCYDRARTSLDRRHLHRRRLRRPIAASR